MLAVAFSYSLHKRQNEWTKMATDYSIWKSHAHTHTHTHKTVYHQQLTSDPYSMNLVGGGHMTDYKQHRIIIIMITIC